MSSFVFSIFGTYHDNLNVAEHRNLSPGGIDTRPIPLLNESGAAVIGSAAMDFPRVNSPLYNTRYGILVFSMIILLSPAKSTGVVFVI